MNNNTISTSYICTGYPGVSYKLIPVSEDNKKKTKLTYTFGGVFDIKGDTNVKIMKVIYNDPATIVFWSDNTKTVAKVHDTDKYDCETGLMICVLKKLSSSESVFKLLNDWLPEEGNIVTMKDVRRRHKNDE